MAEDFGESVLGIEKEISIKSNSAGNVDLNSMQTDKRNKSAHGIGLDSIRISMKKLEGYVWYDCKDNIFSLKMAMPNG